MRNFIKKLCPLFLGAVMLTGNIQSILASDESTETLTDLMIGCDEYKPYNYFDENGNLVGIDADLAEEACHRMGYEPVYVIMKWTEKEAYLDEQIIDCIWDSHSLNGREDSYLWSEPYMYSQESVIVNEDSSINSLDDLNDKNIATLVNTRAEDILLQLDISPEIYPRNIYSFQLMKECLTALRQGYVDAVAGHEGTLIRRTENIKGEYRLLEESLLETDIGVAFSKKADADLVQKLDRVLTDMKEDGTIASIEEKYDVENWR